MDISTPKRRIAHGHAARDNIGDELLVRAIQDGLRRRLDRWELEFSELYSQDTEGEGKREIGPALTIPSRKRIIESVRDADAVLIGGGELIGPFHEYIHTSLYAAQLGIPHLWLGVGGSFDGGRTERRFLKQALCTANMVATRDSLCYSDLSKSLKAGNLIDGRDLVFDLSLPSTSTTREKTIVVTLRGSERPDRWWDAEAFATIATMLRQAQISGYTVHLLPFLSNQDAAVVGSPNLDTQFHSDEDVAEFVSRRLISEQTETTVVGRSIEKATSVIGSARFLVGMRLHSLVIAAKLGTPFIALDYAPKVQRMVGMLGMTDYMISPEDFDHKLPVLITQYMQDNELTTASDLLSKRIPELQASAGKVLDTAARILDQSFSLPNHHTNLMAGATRVLHDMFLRAVIKNPA